MKDPSLFTSLFPPLFTSSFPPDSNCFDIDNYLDFETSVWEHIESLLKEVPKDQVPFYLSKFGGNVKKRSSNILTVFRKKSEGDKILPQKRKHN